MSVVTLHIYDLSGGLAASWSPLVLGRRIEAIYHTGVVVFQREYYFGGGIQQASPGGTVYGRPMRVLFLGETAIDEETLQDFLHGIASRFQVETYDLLTNNCNHFSDELCRFLTGRGIPEEILQLPQLVLNTPLGPILRQLLTPVATEAGTLATASDAARVQTTPASDQRRSQPSALFMQTVEDSASRSQPASSKEVAEENLTPVTAKAEQDGLDKAHSGETALPSGARSAGCQQCLGKNGNCGDELEASSSELWLVKRAELEALGMPASMTSMLSSPVCCCSETAELEATADPTSDQGQALLAQLVVQASEETAQYLLDWLHRVCCQCAGRRKWCAGHHAAFWREIAAHWKSANRLSILLSLFMVLEVLLCDPVSAHCLLIVETNQEWISWLVHSVDDMPLTERRIWRQASEVLLQLGRSTIQQSPAVQENVIAILLWELAEDLQVWSGGIRADDAVAQAIQHLLQELFSQSEVARELGLSLEYAQIIAILLPPDLAARLAPLLEQDTNGSDRQGRRN
jgi:hypothetical protein